MATAIVNGVSFESDAPCEVHAVTWNGSTFKAGSYLLAALFAFQSWLDKKHPGYYLYVIQGGYNTGVKLSAGTHDKDGCVDLAIINRKTGRRYWLGQRWLRAHHFYAWLRNSGSWASMSRWHYHAIVVGIERTGCPVGIFVPGQIADAKAGRSGLVGHVLDRTWRPPVYTPFPYVQWVENQEENMPLSNEDLDKIRQVAREEVERGWRNVQPNGHARAKNLVEIAKAVGVKAAKKVSK